MTEQNSLGVAVTVSDLHDLVGGVASAYVSNNPVSLADLPKVIAAIHEAFVGLDNAGPVEPVIESEIKTPAEIKKSIKPAGLISFIDGKSYKTLKRHLTRHGLTVEQYKAKYGLPVDYPTTAADYSAQRSQLAKNLGLGQRGGAEPQAEAA